MRVDLQDRVAIITGGANGIGRATALLFANAGATVAIWDMAEEAGAALVAEFEQAGGHAAFTRVNVGALAEVEAASTATLAAFGRADILINNAGITRDAQLVKARDGEIVGQMSEADFDAVITINLKGVFNCTQAVVPAMIRQRYGRIISASSVSGVYGNFGQTNYAASKAGVIGMTKVWARELGKYGITANALAPGFIDTGMTRAMPDKIRNLMVERTPVGRAGLPEDVAHAYLFLASNEAGYISGAVLSVDGGAVPGT